MDKVKFVYLNNLEEFGVEPKTLKAFKKEKKANYSNSVIPYTVAVKSEYVEEFINAIKEETSIIDPVEKDILEILEDILECEEIELQSTYDIEPISIDGDMVVNMIQDTIDELFNEDIQEKLLIGNYTTNMNKFVNSLITVVLKMILEDFQKELVNINIIQ